MHLFLVLSLCGLGWFGRVVRLCIGHCLYSRAILADRMSNYGSISFVLVVVLACILNRSGADAVVYVFRILNTCCCFMLVVMLPCCRRELQCTSKYVPLAWRLRCRGLLSRLSHGWCLNAGLICRVCLHGSGAWVAVG